MVQYSLTRSPTFAISFSLAFSILSASCGRLSNRDQDGSSVQGPGVDNLDVSALTGGPLDPLNNPVVIVRSESGFCTGTFVDQHRVLTNAHCVVGPAGLLSPSQLWIEAKASLNKLQERFSVIRIVRSKFVGPNNDDDIPDSESLKLVDYALLDIDNAASTYVPVERADLRLISDAELKSGLSVTIGRFNIGGSDCAGNCPISEMQRATLAFENANVDINAILSDEFRALHPAEKDLTPQNLISSGSIVKSSNLLNTRLRHGNSGSPVLWKGQLIGIVHRAHCVDAKEEATECKGGIFQWTSSISLGD